MEPPARGNLRYWIILSLVIGVILGTVGTYGYLAMTRVPTGPLVRIGYLTGLFESVFYVAKDKGYIVEEGILAEYTLFPAGPQMMEAMKGGSIDVAMGIGSVPGQVAKGNGLDIYLVANINWGNEIIVLRKDLENTVSPAKPESLRGLTIAIPAKGNMQDFIVRVWLERMGINPEKDVKFVEVAAGAAQRSALISKSIDIAVTWEPFGTALAREGLGVVVGDGQSIWPNHDNAGVAVSGSFLSKYRDIVVKLLRALRKGLDYAKQHPQEMYEIASKYTQVPVDVVEESYKKGRIVLPDDLSVNERWYWEVGAWLDKWGYTLRKVDEYLPSYLSVWKELQKF